VPCEGIARVAPTAASLPRLGREAAARGWHGDTSDRGSAPLLSLASPCLAGCHPPAARHGFGCCGVTGDTGKEQGLPMGVEAKEHVCLEKRGWTGFVLVVRTSVEILLG